MHSIIISIDNYLVEKRPWLGFGLQSSSSEDALRGPFPPRTVCPATLTCEWVFRSQLRHLQSCQTMSVLTHSQILCSSGGQHLQHSWEHSPAQFSFATAQKLSCRTDLLGDSSVHQDRKVHSVNKPLKSLDITAINLILRNCKSYRTPHYNFSS